MNYIFLGSTLHFVALWQRRAAMELQSAMPTVAVSQGEKCAQ